MYADQPDRRRNLFYFDVESAYSMSSINLAEYAALGARTALSGKFIANDHPLVATLSVSQRDADRWISGPLSISNFVRYFACGRWHFDTVLKPVCDFILVLCCNYMSTFYHFQDIPIYWSIICVFFAVLPNLISFEAVVKGFPCQLAYKSWCQKRVPRLLGDKNSVILRSLVLSQYQRATNRRTFIYCIKYRWQNAAVNKLWKK